MPTGKLIKTQDNIEKFVNMVVLGCDRAEIVEAIGFKSSTYFAWLADPKIIDEIEKRRAEIKDTGMRFIKGRYKKYLSNIDKLANNFDDKRSALAANQFMIEKIDGKNTARLEVETRDIVVDIVDDEE